MEEFGPYGGPYIRTSPIPTHRLRVELDLDHLPHRLLSATLMVRATPEGDRKQELDQILHGFDRMKDDFEEKLREELHMLTRAQQRKQDAMLRLRRRASAMFHDTYGEYQPPVRPWEEADWDLDNWPLEGIQG